MTDETDNAEFDNAFDAFAKGEEVDDLAAASAADDAGDIEQDDESGDQSDDEAKAAAADGDDSDPLVVAQKERDYWRHKFQSDQGRVSALQRQINALQQSHSAAPKAPSADEVKQATQSEDAWATFAEEYPEMAKAIESKFSSAMKTTVAPLQAAEAQRRTQADIAAVQARHPDVGDVVRSAQFHQWLESQPAVVQQIAKQTHNPDELGWVLDTYKRFTAPMQASPGQAPVAQGQQRRQRVAASETVPSSRASSGRKPIPKDDFDAAFEAYAKQSRYA